LTALVTTSLSATERADGTIVLGAAFNDDLPTGETPARPGSKTATRRALEHCLAGVENHILERFRE
jgi:hypothetical protein